MRPREGEPGKKKDYEPYCSTDPWEGHGTPLRGQHAYPEKPTSAPDPRHLSADIQMEVQVFPGLRPSQVSTQVSKSHVNLPGLKPSLYHNEGASLTP